MPEELAPLSYVSASEVISFALGSYLYQFRPKHLQQHNPCLKAWDRYQRINQSVNYSAIWIFAGAKYILQKCIPKTRLNDIWDPIPLLTLYPSQFRSYFFPYAIPIFSSFTRFLYSLIYRCLLYMLRIRAYKHPCSQNDMIFLYDRMKKATLP